MVSLKNQVENYINGNCGCKLKHILEALGLDKRPEGQDFNEWYQNSYRAVDKILQELKAKDKIEYRKGKGGGWYSL